VFHAAHRLARFTALLLVAVSLAACVGSAGAAGPTPNPTPIPSPTPTASPKPIDPNKVVFRVTWEGGFVTPEMLLERLPLIVVYADGRVISQGPQIEIYPGPLMPNLRERTISAEALDRLVVLAREKDLLRTVHFGFPGIADAPDTVLEIEVDGKSYRVSAAALEAELGLDGDIEPGFEQLDEATVKGRTALRAFIDALTGFPDGDYVDEDHAFVFGGLSVYAGKAIIVPNSELPGEQPAVDWPLEDLATAGEPVTGGGLDVRCQVIEGDDLATVLPLLNGANTLSTFSSEGELYSLIVRPLLPGEAGC